MINESKKGNRQLKVVEIITNSRLYETDWTAYLFRQIIRADVDGCGVFVSFGFGIDVDVDGARLGGIALSGGSTSSWLLFFFFAIA